jgi:hypothetical protein
MQDLAQIRGLSEAKVEKILEAAKKMCTAGGWQSAFEVERQVWSSACACIFNLNGMVYQCMPPWFRDR